MNTEQRESPAEPPWKALQREAPMPLIEHFMPWSSVPAEHWWPLPPCVPGCSALQRDGDPLPSGGSTEHTRFGARTEQ